MKDFDYHAPATLTEATALLAKHNGKAKILAGGTDIIVQLREGLREAAVVIDVKKIPELMELKLDKAGLRLGASVPCYLLYENGPIKAAFSALTDSARIIGGWQIQSRASIGGNLCNSSPAADSTPSLIVLDATVLIASGPKGQREVKARDFCTGPGRNVLKPGELVTTIVLPALAPRSGSAYERFIPRNEMDIAVVGAAAWIQLNASGDKIEAARIALGAVAPIPKFAEEASQSLVGQAPTEAAFATAGELAKKVATPITDMRGPAEYRTHLVGVLVKRTLQTALERARG